VTQAHAEEVQAAVLARLDDALLGMRRLSIKPPVMNVPIPGTNRRIEFARLLACAAVDRLSHETEPVTVKAVAAVLDLEHSTASRLLTEAESDGLVKRLPHPSDRRSAALALTDEGARIARAFAQVRLGFIAGTLSSWSTEDLACFTTLLERFVADVMRQKDCWHDAVPPLAP
jgi:DNA-binding MarR family transcriptional regulator